MRKRIVLLCLLVLSLYALLLLHGRTRKNVVNLAQLNRNSNTPPTATAESASRTNNAPVPPAIANHQAPITLQRMKGSNLSEDQGLLAAWQAPIDFYGKVVDESNNPVAGAGILFNWTENPQDRAGSTSHTASDADGLFALHGARGPSLDVRVGKQGYYTSRTDSWAFSYALSGHFTPDSWNPVVFHLRKKGAGETLIKVKQNYHVPREGTRVGINLTTGKAVTDGSSDLVVQCWTDDQDKRPGQKYDWRCLITIPGGGLIVSGEEYPFLAPTSGYVATNEIAMPATRQDWKNDVDVKFFFQLPNGDYGRMTFSMIAGGDHFCMVDSFLNPSGSPDLEPAQ